MELSRRGFIKLTAASLAASSLGALGFGTAGEALAASVRPFKLDGHDRDPQHLHLLLRRLRHPDLQPWRPRKERQVRHHPYRGGSGSPGQPRHAVPERVGAARYRACADPVAIPEISGARQQRVQAGFLGLCAGPDRHADEAGPRRELHRQERGGNHGQPMAQHRHAGGVRIVQRDRLRNLEGGPRRSEWWSSTTRRASDTDRRWPVWPQHSVAAR